MTRKQHVPDARAARARISALFGALALAAGALAAGSAQAQQSCQEDFKKITDRRMALIAELNKIGKAAKGKMDPIAACPVARKLSSVENEMLGYMEKNKDWCNIPDQVVESFKEARGKTATFASQACAFAAKAKQMQEQQSQGGGLGQPQRLPAGPL
jgi:hypothetical protein